jgi:hypothetical protein
MEDIDKIKQTIEDALEIIPDIEKANDDGKISLMEGGVLVVKHGGKAIRFISSIKEIAKEVIDLDDVESSEIFDMLSEHFGGDDAAKAAIKKIVVGSANISQGIQELLELKNS